MDIEHFNNLKKNDAIELKLMLSIARILELFRRFKAGTSLAVLLMTTTAHAEPIRCPDWRELTLTHEGSAALRAADPTANFEAVLASAEAKGISGPLSARIKSTLSDPKTSSSAKTSSTKNKRMGDQPIEQNSICAYKVKSGDTLAKIAARNLGNANRWTEIRNLNKAALKNPNVLRVGQELKLPCATSGEKSPSKPSTPPEPIWSAKKGEDLEVVLKRWAKAAKYNLVIDTQDAWTLTAPVSIQGDFRGSVKTLIKGLQRSNPIPKVVFFSNKTMELS